MKFGVREICDVVLKAKTAQKIGNKVFYAGEPVCYFDTLKTSSMEGAATTVYAQGGRGNARLMAWEGERTVTFTMEDALISPEGFMILSGAGLIDAEEKPVYQHMTETVDLSNIDTMTDDNGDAAGLAITISKKPYLPENRGDNFAYVMLVRNGEIVSEPYIPVHGNMDADSDGKGYIIKINTPHGNYAAGIPTSEVSKDDNGQEIETFIFKDTYQLANHKEAVNDNTTTTDVDESEPAVLFPEFDSVIVDYYVEHTSGAKQIEITADKFGGNYYLEASTLFRDTNGVDMPAEFIIPNCKVQSNFTFTMASSGDPSSFTFTMDAFPDFTKFDKSKKVLAAIQIIQEAGSQEIYRKSTRHSADHDVKFI
jgi:hypothetical protein